MKATHPANVQLRRYRATDSRGNPKTHQHRPIAGGTLWPTAAAWIDQHGREFCAFCRRKELATTSTTSHPAVS